MRAFQLVPEPAHTSAQTRSSSVSEFMSGFSPATSSFAGAPRTRAGRRCRTARREAPRTPTPSAASISSARSYGWTVGTGCVIRPKTIRPDSSRSSSTGTMPLPVSSAITPSCSGAPRTNAVPRHGMPGERDLVCGVKMRIRTVPPSRGGSTKTVSEKPSSSASCLHRELVEVARVGEDGELVARERPVGEDVGDDVAKRTHRSQTTAPPMIGTCRPSDPRDPRELRPLTSLAAPRRAASAAAGREQPDRSSTRSVVPSP